MVNIQYDKKLYRKDYIRYVLYKRRPYLIVSSIVVSLGIILFIIENIDDQFLSSAGRFKNLIYVIAGIAILSALWDIGKLVINIRISSKQLPTEPQTLLVRQQRLELNHFGHPIVIFVRDLLGYKILKGTVFLIPKNKNSWPIRFNPLEVGPGEMSFLMGELKRLGLEQIKL